MTKYTVITTHGCGKCKSVEFKATATGRADEFEFVDATSELGIELRKKYSIQSAGTIIDNELEKVVEFDAVFS